jgi:hypothetical protein
VRRCDEPPRLRGPLFAACHCVCLAAQRQAGVEGPVGQPDADAVLPAHGFRSHGHHPTRRSVRLYARGLHPSAVQSGVLVFLVAREAHCIIHQAVRPPHSWRRTGGHAVVTLRQHGGWSKRWRPVLGTYLDHLEWAHAMLGRRHTGRLRRRQEVSLRTVLLRCNVPQILADDHGVSRTARLAGIRRRNIGVGDLSTGRAWERVGNNSHAFCCAALF